MTRDIEYGDAMTGMLELIWGADFMTPGGEGNVGHGHVSFSQQLLGVQQPLSLRQFDWADAEGLGQLTTKVPIGYTKLLCQLLNAEFIQGAVFNAP